MILKLLEFLSCFFLAVFSIVIHELAHGVVAYFRGDPTAKLLNRLSLNPIRHVDPFGTIILPVTLYLIAQVGFGWAKPVPINPMYFRYPRFDMILVALAGPLSNFILGFFGYFLLNSFPNIFPIIKDIVVFFVAFNVGIGAFNLLPILPLDGGRVLGELLPRFLAYHWYKLERMGILLVFTLLIVIPQIEKMFNIHIFSLQSFLFASRKMILQVYVYILGFIS